MKKRFVSFPAALLAAVFISSCAMPPDGPPHKPMTPAQDASNIVTGGLRAGDSAINRNSIDAILNNPSPTKRPGLATGWGREKKSEMSFQSFVRTSNRPAGTDAIYYNDAEGIRAMAKSARRVEPMQSAAGGLVEWGIKGRSGFLPAHKEWSGGRRLVAGEKGRNYTIAIKNRSHSPLEIVASVDGLDVQDGRTASFAKRGYIVDPGATLEIEGFRKSYSRIAAFEFSSVSGSYANLRHGETRNVGVIGIALFTQKGVDPWKWMPQEIDTRRGARAFATAP